MRGVAKGGPCRSIILLVYSRRLPPLHALHICEKDHLKHSGHKGRKKAPTARPSDAAALLRCGLDLLRAAVGGVLPRGGKGPCELGSIS